MISTLMCALILVGSVQTWAWGPDGHIVIGTAAARITEGNLKTILHRKTGEGVDRSLQVGIFADYPDFGWKPLGNRIHQLEVVTHIFQIDDLPSGPIPSNYQEAKAKYQGKKGKVTQHPIDFFTTIGTAPWRSEQFRERMVAELKTASNVYKRGDKASAIAHIREAIMIGGIMGHYIGDLSQPLHVAIDYNGWDHNQGGIHSYFEGKIVGALGRGRLEKLVRARAAELYPAVYKKAQELRDPVQLLIYLARDSANLVDTVFKMDRKFSVLEPSHVTPGGRKVSAKRRDPSEVAENYLSIMVERLAIGAAVLKVFFVSAFAEAGMPDFSDLNIGALPDQHAYVEPNYDTLPPMQ